MTEFALTFLLFLTMLSGVFEIGRAIWTFNSLSHAAKEGVRYAMVHGALNPIGEDDPSIAEYAKNYAAGVNPADIEISISYDPDNQPGSMVTVTASYTMNFILARMFGLLSSDMELTGSATKTVVTSRLQDSQRFPLG